MSEQILPPDLLDGPQPDTQRRGLSLGSIVLLGAIVIAAIIVAMGAIHPAISVSVLSFQVERRRVAVGGRRWGVSGGTGVGHAIVGLWPSPW